MSAVDLINAELRRYPGVASAYRVGKNLVCHVRRATSGIGLAEPSDIEILDTPGFRNLFCGYYDHSPFKREDEHLLLVHANNQPAWMHPSPKQPTAILLIDVRSKAIIKVIAHTHTWNWQQGARALWLTNNDVIFNTYDQGTRSYHAIIVSVNSGCSERLPLPVQEIDTKGNVYGISYEALSAIRPDYGYRNKPCTSNDILDNAISAYNIHSGVQKTLATVDDLSREANEHNEFPLTLPRLNHIMASPSGEHLLFLFRYCIGRERITDLYLLEVATQRRDCIARNRGVSHCCWLNDSSIIATMQNRDHGFGYHRFDRQSKTWKRVWSHTDGHPSRRDEKSLLTDTYPDKRGYSHVMAIPLSSPDNAVRLASFAAPLLFHGQTRCDLHPSVSPSGQWIQVDMARNHHRSVGLLPMPGSSTD